MEGKTTMGKPSKFLQDFPGKKKVVLFYLKKKKDMTSIVRHYFGQPKNVIICLPLNVGFLLVADSL